MTLTDVSSLPGSDTINIFLDHCDQPAIVVDDTGFVVACNDNMLKLYQLSRHELLHTDLFGTCKKYDIEPPFRSLQALRNFVSHTTAEFNPLSKHGDKNIQWTTSRFHTHHQKNAFFLIGQQIDISISKRTSEKLRDTMLDNIPAQVFWKNTDLVYQGCNKAFLDSLGLSSKDEVIGKTDFDLPVSGADSAAYQEDDRQVLNSGKAKLNIVERQTLADGSERVLATNKVPLFDEDGKVYGVLAIYIDISERIKTEKALLIANSAKAEFIANMSHDIRTPLGGVIGMAKILEETLTDPQEKQYAQWVNECGQQLLSLLNGILDVVSADNINSHDVTLDTFDLHKCIQDITQLELPTVKLKNIELRIEIDDNIPQFLVSDRTKLHRIILNLLGNAIKYTPKGHVGISIKLLATMKDAVRLQFRIFDTGVGIPDELQPKVFDRFFRVDPSWKGMYKGHGIGLHIAQTYVELLGGEIRLSSKVNQGTTVQFELVMKTGHQSEKMELPGSSSSKTEIQTTCINAHKKIPNLLLIEDNLIALRTIEKCVNKAGYHFTSVTDAETALDMVKKTHFDLIITDLGLPGMSGYELTVAIREWENLSQRKPTPIVGLTAHAGKDVTENLHQAGMNKVFIKPATFELLGQIVEEFVVMNKSDKISKTLGYELPACENTLFDLADFPLLDIENGIKSVGTEDALRELLGLMLEEELPKDEFAIKAAYLENKWDIVEKIAHKMKGGAVYCGTIKLKYACQYLERYRKAGYSKHLERLYLQLIDVVNDTKISIRRWLQQQV